MRQIRFCRGVIEILANSVPAEWVQDWYGAPSLALTDATGATNGSLRVNRGGCWYENAGNLRSANRDNFSVSDLNYGLGFRLVKEL